MLIVLDLYNCAQSFVAAVGHNYHQLHRDNIMPISHLVHIFNTVEYLLNISIHLLGASVFISFPFQAVLQTLPAHLSASHQTSAPTLCPLSPPRKDSPPHSLDIAHPISSLDVCKKGSVILYQEGQETMVPFPERGGESVAPCSKFTENISAIRGA